MVKSVQSCNLGVCAQTGLNTDRNLRFEPGSTHSLTTEYDTNTQTNTQK